MQCSKRMKQLINSHNNLNKKYNSINRQLLKFKKKLSNVQSVPRIFFLRKLMSILEQNYWTLNIRKLSRIQIKGNLFNLLIIQRYLKIFRLLLRKDQTFLELIQLCYQNKLMINNPNNNNNKFSSKYGMDNRKT